MLFYAGPKINGINLVIFLNEIMLGLVSDDFPHEKLHKIEGQYLRGSMTWLNHYDLMDFKIY